MKKYNIPDMNIHFIKNDSYYEVDVYYDVIKIICTKIYKNVKIYDEICIKLDDVTIKRIFKYKDKESSAILSNLDKDEIVNSIFNELENNYITKDLLFLDKIKNIVKNSYTNIVMANNELGLSYTDKNIKSNLINLDIISFDKEEIIGSIKIIDDNIAINVDSIYYEDIKILLNKFICLFKKDVKELKKVFYNN